MNFREAESYLLSLGNEVETMKLGLDNIRKLLAALGNPQDNYLKVQVAGTNGKGSVCAFLDSICLHAGIRTGVFTSPHLVSITERIRINGVDISEDEFARLSTRMREVSEALVSNGELENVPTFFEQVTAIALLAFAESGAQIAILETGLGGRYDAVTAAKAEIVAITRIDLDHQEYLGGTIEKIAAEKAAIIGPDTTAVVGEQPSKAMRIILKQCIEVGVEPVTECEAGIWAMDATKGSVVAFFRTPRGTYSDANLGLSGRHQLENSRIAVLASELLRYVFTFPIDEDDVLEGLENARHPGRLAREGRYLFDGAHNVGGANALRSYLDEFVTQSITMIFGVMNGKDVSEMAAILWPKAERVILTKPDNSRAMPADELAAFIPETVDDGNIVLTKSVREAIERANELSGENSIILVTGSLYLVGEVKKLLNN